MAYVQRLFTAALFATANHCKQYKYPPANNGPSIQRTIIKQFKNGYLLYFNMERLLRCMEGRKEGWKETRTW